MWITKKRLELEKDVAIQEVLSEIIKRSKTKEPFIYSVTTHSMFKDSTTERYVIRAKTEESKD